MFCASFEVDEKAQIFLHGSNKTFTCHVQDKTESRVRIILDITN